MASRSQSAAQKPKQTKKKTSAAKPASGSASSAKKQSRSEQQYQHRKQLYAIVLFAVGIFVTALSLLDGPAFWGGLHDFLRGLFGPISYGAGPIIIYIAVIITLISTPPTRSGRCWC